MKRDALETDKILVTYPSRWNERIQQKSREIAMLGLEPKVQDVWRWAMAVALFPEECRVERKEQK
jgi:hypothetical protein